MRDKEKHRKQNREYYKRINGGLPPSQQPYNTTPDERDNYPNQIIKRQQDFIYNR